MTFAEQLQMYMTKLGISGRELAREAGISESTLSRYRSGERMPSSDEKKLRSFSEAMIRAAAVEELSLSADEIYNTFYDILGTGIEVSYETYLTNLHQLMEIMGIRSKELARELSFDPSYISRIMSGKRKPSELKAFNLQVVTLVSKKAKERGQEETLSILLRIPLDDLKNEKKCTDVLLDWLNTNTEKVALHPIRRLLREVEEIDLVDFFKSVNMDRVNQLVRPEVSVPKRQVAVGLSAILEIQVEFFRLSVLNRSNDPVFFYTDISVEEMAERAEFVKQYILGLSALLHRGLKIRIIQNVHRPLKDMLFILELHLPLYLTGQVEAYWLPKSHGELFTHQLWLSGGLALFGEAVTGHTDEGIHILTNHAKELQYARKRAERLMEQAQPILQIYQPGEYDRVIADYAELLGQGNRSQSYSYLPAAFLKPEEIDLYMKKAGMPEEERELIIKRTVRRWNVMKKNSGNHHIRLFVPDLSREEFQKNPVVLSLADLGADLAVEYDYEEYRHHLSVIRKVVEGHKNVELVFSSGHLLRYVNLYLIHGKAVILTKSRSPLSCIVIRHPSLLRAFEEMMKGFYMDAKKGATNEKNDHI